MLLPSIDRDNKKEKKWKTAIPILFPNIYLNDSDPDSHFKLLKSFSLTGPNLVLTFGTIKVSSVYSSKT